MQVSYTAFIGALVGLSHSLSISVASEGGNATNPLQYGIMFEDINHSGDGGIYAELIRNRAFQGSEYFPSSTEAWEGLNAIISLQNLSTPLSDALPTSLNVAALSSDVSAVGIANYEWWGIDVKEQDYQVSFFVLGDYSGDFNDSLQSYLTNETFGSAVVSSQATSNGWVQHNFTLTPTKAATNVNNTFVISFDSAGVSGGSLDFNLVSLFPPTFKDRPNGFRSNLMEALAELTPSFLRLPGGNNLEGDHAPYYWNWNATIGPLEDRPEPILGVWGGFYLDGTIIDNNTLPIYIQEALDELEFLTGSVDTTLGAYRASLGYPEPWTIKYVEVGNEDNLNGGLTSYQDYRLPDYYEAIKAKYPDIEIIGSTVAVTLPGDSLRDYHDYNRPDLFASRWNLFNHNSTEHLTFVSEYAVIQYNRPEGGGVDWNAPRAPFPFWIGTVAEAVFLIGGERNSDVVLGAAYAPLLQNLNSYQWAPDLISFTADPSQTVLSTSWHLVKLFSNTRTTSTLPTTTDQGFDPVFWVAGINEDTGSHILKSAVYNSTAPVTLSVAFEGAVAGQEGTLTILTAPDALSYNEIGTDIVDYNVSTVPVNADGLYVFTLPDLSIALLEVKSSKL